MQRHVPQTTRTSGGVERFRCFQPTCQVLTQFCTSNNGSLEVPIQVPYLGSEGDFSLPLLRPIGRAEGEPDSMAAGPVCAASCAHFAPPFAKSCRFSYLEGRGRGVARMPDTQVLHEGPGLMNFQNRSHKYVLAARLSWTSVSSEPSMNKEDIEAATVRNRNILYPGDGPVMLRKDAPPAFPRFGCCRGPTAGRHVLLQSRVQSIISVALRKKCFASTGPSQCDQLAFISCLDGCKHCTLRVVLSMQRRQTTPPFSMFARIRHAVNPGRSRVIVWPDRIGTRDAPGPAR